MSQPRRRAPPPRPAPPAAGRGGRRPAPAAPPPRRAAPARAPAASPCAACAAAARTPARPCAPRQIQIRCPHCGTASRSFRGIDWTWPGPGVTATVPPRTPRPYDRLDITAQASANYAERLHLAIAMHACHHPTVHPQVTLTGASDGRPRVFRGSLRIDFTLGYPGFFSNAVALARGGSLGAALAALFFPAPRRYGLTVTTCGVRTDGAGARSPSFDIYVYPSDTFKLSMSLPSLWKRSAASGGGTVGDAQYQMRQRGRTTGRQEDGTTATTYREGGRTIRRLEETSANAAGGVAQTRVRSGGAGSNVIVESPATDPAYRSALNSIKLERNGGDVSASFGLARIASAVETIRRSITSLFGYFQQLANALPEIGWRMGWGLELLSGSLAIEWGWKEASATNRTWKWIKVGADLTLAKVTFTVSFGARVLRVGAKVELELSAELGLEGAYESTPANHASFSIVTRATGQGVLRVVAGWESTLELEASVRTGLSMTSTMTWNPAFSWTLGAKLLAGKGNVKATVFGFEYGREWTFWEERPLMANHDLVG